MVISRRDVFSQKSEDLSADQISISENLGKILSRCRDLPRSPPISRSHPISPESRGSTSNARPACSGSSYGPIRPRRPLRHACRPARTAERYERHSNGPSAAATAEDREAGYLLNEVDHTRPIATVSRHYFGERQTLQVPWLSTTLPGACHYR